MTDVLKQVRAILVSMRHAALQADWETFDADHRAALEALNSAIDAQQVAAPPEFDRATALVLLCAASMSGDPGAISLAAQLAGAAPCTTCDYVNFRCRCGAAQASLAQQPIAEASPE